MNPPRRTRTRGGTFPVTLFTTAVCLASLISPPFSTSVHLFPITAVIKQALALLQLGRESGQSLYKSCFIMSNVKIIAVTGATGAQGGGVVNIMKKTPGWRVRAVTRNTESEAAKKLAADGSVEVVRADWNDEASLVEAFKVSIPPKHKARYRGRLISSPASPPLPIVGCCCRLRCDQLVGVALHGQVAVGVR